MDRDMRKKTLPILARIPGFFPICRFLSGLSAIAVRQSLLWSVLVISVIAYDHNLRHQALSEIKPTAKTPASLPGEAFNEDPQINSFRTKIDSLRLQLARLNQLAEKIKIAAGLEKKGSGSGKPGMGGSFAKNVPFSLADPAAYNKWVKDLDAEIEQLDDSSVEQFDEYQVLLATVKEIKKIQEATPSIFPVEGGSISSEFGYRQSPFKDSREFHSGLDISSHKGTSVKATANGFILYAGYNGDLGKEVIIDHGFGIVTTYGHMSEVKVKTGQQIQRGSVIGRVGNTGRSTGPHLHYEVRLNNNPINPQKYIPKNLASLDLSK
jgi:murein DD-endopeptidase MepM/ murein hydrolase activator NlpD